MRPYEVVTSVERLPHIAQEIAEAEWVALDLECTGLDPHTARIRLLSLNTGKGVYVIDLFQTGTLGPVVDALRNSAAIKIGQNLKFDQKFLLHNYKLELWPIFDTYCASVLIYNGKYQGRGSHDLYALYARELQIAPEAEDLGASNWSGPLTKSQLDYAAEDVIHLPALRAALKPKLADGGLNRVALIEFRAIVPVAAMELNGFAFDRDAWLKLAAMNTQKAAELRRQLVYELPHPKNQLSLPGIEPDFNLNSSQQLLQSLRMIGLQIENTSEMTLAMFAQEFPIIKKVLEWRGYNQAVKTFGAEFVEYINPRTGRIHTSFFPFTGAGRYASGDPNLQNIPRDKAFRHCFMAPRGKKLVLVDYSQIELRIAGEISGDQRLMGVYIRGEDAHAQTASLVANVPLQEVTKEQRQMAKAVNFGLVYGMQAAKLVLYAQANYKVALTMAQAELFRRRYFDSYNGVAAWHREIFSDEHKRSGVARTLGGRVRYLRPDMHNEYANCLDGETEALTRRGWVRGFDLRRDDVLLTKNPNTGILEWQPMDDLRLFPDYEGPIVEFRSRSFHAVSTPEHRWLVRDKASGQDIERTTRTLSPWGDHRIHRTGDYRPEVSSGLTPDEAELLGWFVTDGYVERGQVRQGKFHPFRTPQAFLTQSLSANEAKCSRIDALLARLGGITGRYERPYTISEQGTQIIWNLGKRLSALLLERCPERMLRLEALLDLDRTCLERLREAMILGDGTVDRDSGKTVLCTGRKAQAETFQILCTLTGTAASIAWRDMSQYAPRSTKLANSPKSQGCWQVTILRRTTAQVVHSQRHEIIAKCPVWCPVVPNTFFVARRSGHVMITGNTPVQGTGADGFKAALWDVYSRLKKYGDSARMVHMVHDEIITEVDDEPELLAAVKTDVDAGMLAGMQPLLRRVPVITEGKIGPDWAEK